LRPGAPLPDNGQRSSEAHPFEHLDRQYHSRALSLIGISTGCLTLLIVAIATLVRGRLPPSAVFSLPLAASMLAAPVVLRRGGSPARAAGIPAAALVALLPGIAIMTGGTNAPVIVALPLAPLLLSFFVPLRLAIAFGAALLAEVVPIWGLTRAGWLPASGLSAGGLELLRAVLVGGCLLITLVAVYFIVTERELLEARLREAARKLYEASVRDPLTGLHNRRYVTERLQAELAYATRHRTELAIALLDIDHFKQVNDRYGHEAGDLVLIAVGERIRLTLRTEDVVARYGGEELLILMRGETIQGALMAAERVRTAIAGSPVTVAEHSIAVTVSIGCAALTTAHDRNAAALIAQADDRLYAAKHAGRDRVVGAVAASLAP
jgi:diguanylate cyclase (GGDEF)-like protein